MNKLVKGMFICACGFIPSWMTFGGWTLISNEVQYIPLALAIAFFIGLITCAMALIGSLIWEYK